MTPARFALLVASAVLATATSAAGATWRLQPTPSLGAVHGQLTEVSCPARTACVAVGSTFTTEITVRRPLAELWNGRSWRIARLPRTPERHGQLISVSCTAVDACTAVGDLVTAGGASLPLAERWNGTSWSLQRVPRPTFPGFGLDDATLQGVRCMSSAVCIAVGSRDRSGQPLAERWNGRRWSIAKTPSPGVDGGSLFALSCTTVANCTAVGAFGAAATGCATPLVERLTGSGWSLEHAARLPRCGLLNNSAFEAVWCESQTLCTAVGGFNSIGSAYATPLIEHQTSGGWSIRPTPDVRYLSDPWGGGGYLFDLSCEPTLGCIAVGFAGSGIVRTPLVERLVAGRWRVQRIPRAPAGSDLLGIGCSPTGCTAVGLDDVRGPGSDAPLVERFS